MTARGPDDWHQVVDNWDWGDGLRILAWITSRTDCDRATAQHVIGFGSQDYFLRFPDREAVLREEPSSLEDFDLLAAVVARWNAGFYVRSEIATTDPEELAAQKSRHEQAVVDYADKGLPWRVDDSVFQPLSGRAGWANWESGFPPEVAADLAARGIRW